MTAKYKGADFSERFGPWAVIAGGSDGIGAAFAAELAQRGLNLVLIGRDEAKLSRKAAEIRANSASTVQPLCLDLTRPDLGDQVATATADLDVGLFIYNAGSGRQMGSFLDHPIDNWMRQVHLACSGPLALSHHFGGRLRLRGRDGIVLMSSLSSLVGSAYYRHLLRSQGLRHDSRRGALARTRPCRSGRRILPRWCDRHRNVSRRYRRLALCHEPN